MKRKDDLNNKGFDKSSRCNERSSTTTGQSRSLTALSKSMELRIFSPENSVHSSH